MGTPVHDYADIETAAGGRAAAGMCFWKRNPAFPGGLITEGVKAGTLDYYDCGANITITLPEVQPARSQTYPGPDETAENLSCDG